MARLKECSEYLRHDFTDAEKLTMGAQLAASYSRLSAIKEEKGAAVAQFAEREKSVVAEIGALSRKYNSGFEMETVRCRLAYGEPNPMEVTYYRLDNGEKVKTRAMLPDEMQEELPLTDREGEVVVIPPAQAEASAEKSAENIAEFFGDGNTTPESPEEADGDPEQPETPFDNPKASPAANLSEDELYAKVQVFAAEGGKATAKGIQKHLGISYADAVALFDRYNKEKESPKEVPQPEVDTPW